MSVTTKPNDLITSLNIKEHFLFLPCDISFSKPTGEFGSGINYIVGESGSGKTRFLELICGKFLSRRSAIRGDGLDSIPTQFYKEEVTKADFELKTDTAPNIILPDSIRIVPSSGKFEYVPNPHLTTRGEVINHKRLGKNGKSYLITKDSLGTGEFSADFLKEKFAEANTLGYSTSFIIEEPEYGKDPITQLAIMEIINEAARKHQIFITTHSPIVVDWNCVRGGASIVKLSRKDKETTIGIYKGDVPEFLIKTTKAHLGGMESKSFLFSNKVCVVEGQEDVGYLQVYFGSDLHGNKFSKPNFAFFGYGADGQGNINPILDICAKLKIPKVVAIYDGDQSPETTASYDQAVSNVDFSSLGYQIKRLRAPDIRTKVKDGNEVIGVFNRSDGSSVAFSANTGYQADFEQIIEETFEYFKD